MYGNIISIDETPAADINGKHLFADPKANLENIYYDFWLRLLS